MAEINAQTTDDSGTIDANEALILGAIDISLNRTRLFSLHIFFLLQLLWFAFLLVCLSLPIIFNFYFSCLSFFFSPFGNRKCGRFDFDFFRGLTLASPEYLQQINFPVTWFQAHFCKCKYIKKKQKLFGILITTLSNKMKTVRIITLRTSRTNQIKSKQNNYCQQNWILHSFFLFWEFWEYSGNQFGNN